MDENQSNKTETENEEHLRTEPGILAFGLGRRLTNEESCHLRVSEKSGKYEVL